MRGHRQTGQSHEHEFRFSEFCRLPLCSVTVTRRPWQPYLWEQHLWPYFLAAVAANSEQNGSGLLQNFGPRAGLPQKPPFRRSGARISALKATPEGAAPSPRKRISCVCPAAWAWMGFMRWPCAGRGCRTTVNVVSHLFKEPSRDFRSGRPALFIPPISMG